MSVTSLVMLSDVQFVVGESLPVQIKLFNDGPQRVEVAHDEASYPFEYVVSQEGEVRAVISGDRFMRVVADTSEAPARPVLALGPKSGVTYHADVARYALSAVPPGAYDLVVRNVPVDDGTAPIPIPQTLDPQPFEVLPLSPQHFLSSAGPFDETLPGFMAHDCGHAEGGGLYQQETTVRRSDRPLVPAPWFRHMHVAAPISSISGSVATARATFSGRWGAWLQDGSAAAERCDVKPTPSFGGPPPAKPVPLPGAWFGCIYGWNAKILATSELCQVGLEAPRLLDIGFQYEAMPVEFLVLGTTGSRVVVDEMRSAPGQPTHTHRIALGVPVVPAAMFVHAEANRTKRFVYEHGGRVYIEGVPADAAASGGASELLGGASPVLRVAVSAAGPPAEAFVDALFAPEGDGLFILRRKALDGRDVGSWSFEGPRGDDEPLVVDDWILCATPADGAPLLARCGSIVYAGHVARGAAWSKIAEGVSSVLRLNALLDGTVIASWIDPSEGVKHVRVP